MYVRLAFAVAAHLEPEIMVVDEVLSVGDADFQKKCLGKMGEIAGQGRTVLFVSHNMTAVRGLCTKGILLEKGQVQLAGPVAEALQAYSGKSTNLTSFSRAPRHTGKPTIIGVSVLKSDGNSVLFEITISAKELRQ